MVLQKLEVLLLDTTGYSALLGVTDFWFVGKFNCAGWRVLVRFGADWLQVKIGQN